MDFPFGPAVFRDRRRPVPDPYNPASTVPGSWDGPLDTIRLGDDGRNGAFVASSSSVRVTDATRTQILTAKSLYCDPDEDVRVGDRIRVGAETYEVEAKPAGDTNPFTGWRPVQEIPLKNATG